MADSSQNTKPFYDLATILDPPYIMGGAEGKEHQGFVMDVLENVASQGNFKYKLKVLNGSYGHLQSDGHWSGLIGAVPKLPADMAVGAVAMTEERTKVLQFTEVFHRSSIQLLLPRPVPEESPGAVLLLAPFTPGAWALLVIAFLLVSVSFFLIGRLSPSEWVRVPADRDVRRARHSFGLRNSFLFTVSTFTWQGYREAPKSLAGRTLAVGWWVFVLLMLVAYSSNLTALVSSRPHLQPTLSFRNYEDLLRDGKIDVGMIRYGDADAVLRNSDYSMAKQMYEYVSNRHNWVDNLDDGLQRMRSSNGMFALLLPGYKARHLVSKECDLITYGHGLGIIEYAFAFPKGMSYSESLRRRINSALLAMRETGDLDRLQDKWDGKGGKCTDPEGSSLPVRRADSGLNFMALGPRDLAVPFLFLFFCGFLALGVAALEVLRTRGLFAQLLEKREGDAEAGEMGKPLKARAGGSGQEAKAAKTTIEDEADRDEDNDQDNDDNKTGDQYQMEPDEKDKQPVKMEMVTLESDDDAPVGGEGK